MTYEFLIVDEFLKGFVESRALKSALELGVIDALKGDAAIVDLEIETDEAGLGMLLEMLKGGGVIWMDGGKAGWTERFKLAMKYRDLLEVKLEMADFVAGDAVERMTTLLRDPGRFMAQSRLMGLFDYSKCLKDGAENVLAARRWMKYTTALTRYEAMGCWDVHDVSGYRRMLDVGGNSGEFALSACRKNAGLRATVLDLPAVCAVGREHVAGCGEGGRIEFVAGDAMREDWPGGWDLVTFKSVLHDWPGREAGELIARGAGALAPGGTMLIFERGRLDAGKLGYGDLPILLFFRHFREPGEYEGMMRRAGLGDIEVKEVEMGQRYYVVTGKKGR